MNTPGAGERRHMRQPWAGERPPGRWVSQTLMDVQFLARFPLVLLLAFGTAALARPDG
jgi:hypothetical protein